MRSLNKDGFAVKGDEGLVVVGISVSWGGKDAYYISLQQEQSNTGITIISYSASFTLSLLLLSFSVFMPFHRYQCKLSPSSSGRKIVGW